jgi:ABC-type transport system substrate-binding protein
MAERGHEFQHEVKVETKRMDRAEVVKRAAAVSVAGPSLFLGGPGTTFLTRRPTLVRELAKDLRVGVSTLNDQVLDPSLAVTSSLPWLELVFDYLIGIDAVGKPSKETGIATDWVVKKRATGVGATYTLKLRKNIRFSNGDLLTSADVKYSLDKNIGLNPPSKFGSAPFLIQLIESVDAPDPFTVVINAKTFSAILLPFLSRSGDGAGLMRPMNYATQNSAIFKTTPIGTGPYRVAQNASGSQIRFESTGKPHWLHGKQRFESVTLLPRAEESVAIAGLLNGELDLVNVSAAGSTRVNSSSNLGLARVPRFQPAQVLS